jgi:16S rRNA G966 N2-methylase RsmD
LIASLALSIFSCVAHVERGKQKAVSVIDESAKEALRKAERAKYVAQTKSGCSVADLTALAQSGRRFGVIYADPPWRFEVYCGKNKQRSAERHYDTVPLAAIKALPIGNLAADDCALLLWAVMSELPGALEVIKA